MTLLNPNSEGFPGIKKAIQASGWVIIFLFFIFGTSVIAQKKPDGHRPKLGIVLSSAAFGYASFIDPVEISFMRSNFNDGALGYINIGYYF